MINCKCDNDILINNNYLSKCHYHIIYKAHTKELGIQSSYRRIKNTIIIIVFLILLYELVKLTMQ